MSMFKQFQDIVSQIVRSSGANYARPWPCKVVSQSGQSIDVIPDSSDLPHMTGIPIRSGVPGVWVTVKPGARCRIQFDEGNPAKPFAALWDIDGVTSINIGGESGAPIAREGDPVLVALDTASITILAAMISATSLNAPCAVNAAAAGIELAGVIVGGSSIAGAT
jgi:hypothetical protein